MPRFTQRAILVLALGGAGFACTKAEPPPALDPREAAEARRMLQSYVDAMHEIAQSGEPSVAREVFEEMRETCKRAEVPDGFAPRFTRLVDATAAVFEPDRGGEQTLKTFVKAVRGPEAELDIDGGLAAIAPVFVEEVVAIRLLLDPEADPADVKRAYFPDA